jgi:hypothetical protein
MLHHTEKFPYFYKLHQNANKRQIWFDVTRRHLLDLFCEQKGRCHYTDIQLVLSDKQSDLVTQTASIDRIDSDQGYVMGNVVWCHKDVNRIKRSLSLTDFVQICREISLFDQVFTHQISYTSNTHRNFKGYKGLTASHFSLSVSTCANRKTTLDHDLTIKQAWDLFESQSGQCALSGRVLYLNSGFRTDPQKSTASLDRINNDVGYTIDNVQWVHKEINKMRWHLDLPYFLSLCQKVYSHVG